MSSSADSPNLPAKEHFLPSNYTPFILLTPRLLLAPTPSLLPLEAYRSLYASLHADANFCEMAFGPDWGPRNWDAKEGYEMIEKEVERNWAVRRMGDMGVAKWDGRRQDVGRVLRGVEQWEEIRLVEGDELDKMVEDGLWEQVEWVGYAGVREARLPPLEEGDDPRPSWLERESLPPVLFGLELITELALSSPLSHRDAVRPLFCSLGTTPCTRVGKGRPPMGISRARCPAIHRGNGEAQREKRGCSAEDGFPGYRGEL